jgi:polygalacturonase
MHMHTKRSTIFLAAAGLSLLATAAMAQTLATGDSRTVSTPSYPTVCQTLTAQFTTSERSSPPSSDDTSRIQSALTACAGTGKSVVLASTGSYTAFFTGRLVVSGEGLVVNSGVTLYGNNSYYKSYDPQDKSELLYVTGTNSSIMGPGTIDGRGDIESGTPRLVEAYDTTNFTVYNVTLTQSVHPNLYVEGGSGFTAYNITINTPADRHNADGIDIDSISNATVYGSTINAGDDGIAIKTNSGAAANITVKNSKFYGTHGLSIGSQTMYGVTNVLFSGNYVYGVDKNSIKSTDANAINIKTDEECGGTVSKVTYLNTCITEAKHLIVLDTEYGDCEGTAGTPVLSDIVINGVKSTSSLTNAYTRIRGYSTSYPVNAYLANISLDIVKQSDDQDATVYLYNSNITPSGTDVTDSSFTLSGSVPSCSF